ncbi:sensor domain-containing diguanylate cyclase [Duganella sp. LX20W]|uniref:Sensor domain-containing diguanylate cyclase n=1 Tax=Rugamonas brunnea TaxID=2758569 RepID=A0A7W2I9T7_9BURK|nr:sensor domain-containing diguanylate cyclase [Rugamonas brunnea]MBA5635473.1 sensor domain-containing diguanylate cyclase [Rugamonas brunnea]
MAEPLHIEPAQATGVQSRRLILIAWLFSAIIVLVLLFTYYGIGLLSAGRAYVGGEGLWSKAQKDAVFALGRYTRYHEESDFDTYRAALDVILGDRQARLELEKAAPDLARARDGFLRGRNHPDDIDGMIGLFRHFRHIPDIDQAIDIWTRADAMIDQLMALAARVRASAQAGQVDNGLVLAQLRELNAINERLRPLEDDFSATLGRAARTTKVILLAVLFMGAALLLGAAILFSRRMVRQSEQVERALRQGEQQLRRLLQFAPLPIVIVRSSDNTILFANEHALKQFKLEAASLAISRPADFYLRNEDREALFAHLRQHRSVSDWEVRMQDAHGIPFWASMSCQCISYDGQECVLTALNNIELRKRNQQELQRRAFYDELTALPNRAMFMEALDDQLARNAADGGTFALMFIDVDRFKIINDELGHDAGDKLLQEVAARLTASVHETDLVARLGGDEFVVLVTEKTDTDFVNQTARAIMAAMAPNFHFDRHEISVTISIGISCYPHDGVDLMTMMKNADVAMYRAKERGRNNFQWYGTQRRVARADA